ncbi:MAG: glycosyltransferase family 39 protein [Opitutae bacterium]|nr:glycosyltransferase family 39 protein [Opitutae bacterium]
MDASPPASVAPPAAAPRAVAWRRAVALGLVMLALLAGWHLRWRHLAAAANHPDEAIPVALIAHARSTGDWDLNPAKADLPPIFRYNQYAGSSYHYAVWAWDAAIRHVAGRAASPDADGTRWRLRVFSAVWASLALAGIAVLAWQLAGPVGAVAGTMLAAFNPVLVQDAHYARPDAMLTALALGYLWLWLRGGPWSRGRLLFAGALLGVMVAGKNTMGLFALAPLVNMGRRGEAGWWRAQLHAWGIFTVAALAAFLLAEPGVWWNFSAFCDGVQRLVVQYSHPFPVSGPLDGGASYGLATAYFTATLGVGAAVLAFAGMVAWLRQRAWRVLTLWVLPAVAFAAYFGGKSIFFERAYSPVLPGVCLLVGVGASAVARWRPAGWLLAGGLTLTAVLPGATISTRWVYDVLSGSADAPRRAYETQLAQALAPVPIHETWLCMPVQVEAWTRRWEESHTPFVLRIYDFEDAWTKRWLDEFMTRVPTRPLSTVRGPLADIPVSTLQVYHVPTWRYIWVGDAAPPVALPAVPPPGPSFWTRVLSWWVDAPWRYHALAWMAGLWPLVLAVGAVRRELRGAAPVAAAGVWLFPLSIGVALLAFRWPTFFHHPELNVDEAHTIAGAITLQHHPVYWKSVDGTTHGPLNDFVLLLPRLVGLPVDFATARAVGLLLVAGALIALWWGLRRLWGEAVARVAVLPALAFFALSTFWDFVHYTSEHLPIFLLTAAFALLVEAARGCRRWWCWLVAGLLLGAIPYAKMQGVPVAAVLAVGGAWAAWRGGRSRAVGALVLGGLLPTLGCIGFLATYNLWRHFWETYLLNNLRYATETKMYSLGAMLRALPAWMDMSEGLTPCVVGLLVGALGALGVAAWARGRRSWWPALGAAVVLAAALYAAIASGRQFPHYLLLVVVPLAGLGAAGLALAWSAVEARGRCVFVAIFLLAGLVPQIVARVQRSHPYLTDVRTYDARRSAVAQEISLYARPGEYLGIWGYMPRYYVETGMPHASREGHNERQMIPQPQSDYYRGRYLGDLRRRRPPMFLDAVGAQAFWPHDRAAYGHETWPELRAWVEENYRFVAERDTMRIYVRRDRLPTR